MDSAGLEVARTGPVLKGHPNGLEIRRVGEVGGHVAGLEFGSAWADGAELGRELAGGHAPEVGAGEDGAAGGEAGEGELEEAAVVVLDAEDLAFVVAGEGGRVEDDGVELPALFREAAKPVEGVAFAKVVLLGIHVIGPEVLAGPVEIDLGEVEGRGGGSGGSGGDGEEAGVGKGVEYGLARLDELAEGSAVVALIDENALGVSGLKREAAFEAVFEPEEKFGHFVAAEMDGRFLLVLIEAFPVERFAVCRKGVAESGIEAGAGGRDEPALAIAFQVAAGESVARTINEPHQIGPGAENAGSFCE